MALGVDAVVIGAGTMVWSRQRCWPMWERIDALADHGDPCRTHQCDASWK